MHVSHLSLPLAVAIWTTESRTEILSSAFSKWAPAFNGLLDIIHFQAIKIISSQNQILSHLLHSQLRSQGSRSRTDYTERQTGQVNFISPQSYTGWTWLPGTGSRLQAGVITSNTYFYHFAFSFISGDKYYLESKKKHQTNVKKQI